MKTPSSLLPSGFLDLLSPKAWQERGLRQTALDSFRSFGYEEVSPPFLEFEDSLLDQSSLDRQTFRVMDATSQRMMGLRADMTPQIARIAASRMHDHPLPLRLCYAGTCLRVKGEGLHKARQLVQAGIECIGVDNERPLIEVLRCAYETLTALNNNDVTLDITLPGLTAALLREIPKEKREIIRRAIEQKDRHEIGLLNHPISSPLLELMDGATLEKLEELADYLPSFVSAWLDQIAIITKELPEMVITLDPLEESGFGYYEGIAFSFFSKSLGCEIGRGGRYIAHENLLAYGFTLYLSPILPTADKTDNAPRCLILNGADETVAHNLRKKGWHTLYGHATSAAEATEELKRLRCTYLLEKEEVINV